MRAAIKDRPVGSVETLDATFAATFKTDTSGLTPAQWHEGLYIKFKGEVSVYYMVWEASDVQASATQLVCLQAGMDWGALTREWATLVCGDLFHPVRVSH